MLYSKQSLGLFECAEAFLEKSIKILREDKHAAQRLRLSAQSVDDTFITSEKPAYLTTGDDPNQWVSVVAMKSLASRDISSYAESARNENAPLSPPMCIFTFQTGVSYVNFLNAMNQGTVLSNVTVSRVHQGGDAGIITTTESHSYSNCQILIINKEDIGNVSLACVIIQSNAVTLTYAPVPAAGGAPVGSYQSTLTSSSSSTYTGS